jgi:hypothetical protein
MANLKLTIQDDIKAAMKNKDAFSLGVLRMVSAAIKNKELEKRTKLAKSPPASLCEALRAGGSVEKLDKLSQLTEEEVVGVVLSEVKKRKDAAREFESGGRPELAEKELKEAELLKKYLPKQMSEDEIRKLVAEAVKNSGATSIKEIGKVMGLLMPQIKNRADGGMVQRIVQKELSGN